MEAMILRSDNTATDMMFKVAGADNVRAFIASAGLANTLVPGQHTCAHRLSVRRAGLQEPDVGASAAGRAAAAGAPTPQPPAAPRLLRRRPGLLPSPPPARRDP